jgi:hypothetical protein
MVNTAVSPALMAPTEVIRSSKLEKLTDSSCPTVSVATPLALSSAETAGTLPKINKRDIAIEKKRLYSVFLIGVFPFCISKYKAAGAAGQPAASFKLSSDFGA